MRQIIEHILSFLNKRWIGSVFIAILFFFIIYWNYKDWEFAFQCTIFTHGMFSFNFAVCLYYRDLKANRFNFKVAATPKSWMYFGVFTGGTIIAFLIFLPKIFWLYGGIMSGCLLAALFIFDLIKNGLR